MEPARARGVDWTERHRPRSLAEMVGNGPAVARMRAWADAWRTGMPERRALVLAGPPGTGKTSAAHALANDMGWLAIELNASDARNAQTIRRVATAGAIHQTLGMDGSFHAAGAAGAEGGRKLIILDEADNLYERVGGGGRDAGGEDLSDRGGKGQIIETIRQARQPILLIVNDLYALEKGSGSALKSLAETVKFQRLQARSIAPALDRIARAEKVHAPREVLEAIAVKAEGDLRAAVRDLQAIAQGRERLTVQDLASLGPRDTTATLFDVVRHVLKGRRLEEVRREVWSVDATPEDLVLWVDENMPKEYRDPEDLARGYEMLSRADVFLGRTRSTQDFGLWSYAGELATVGVMTARQREYRDYVPFGFPQWLSKMSRTRGVRQAKDELAGALGAATHASRRKTRTDQVEAFQAIFQADAEFAAHQTWALGLDDEAVALLLGPQATSARIKRNRADVERLEEEDGKAAAPHPIATQEDEEAVPSGEGEAKPAPAAGQKRLF